MTNIKPIEILSIKANKMLVNVVENTPKQKKAILDFLKEANVKNTQGNAIISYFTELNKLFSDKTLKTSQEQKRLNNAPLIISKFIEEDNFILKKQATLFVKSLKKNYPKTLNKRVSLAVNGTVTADKITPISKKSRFHIFIDKIINFYFNNF